MKKITARIAKNIAERRIKTSRPGERAKWGAFKNWATARKEEGKECAPRAARIYSAAEVWFK